MEGNLHNASFTHYIDAPKAGEIINQPYLLVSGWVACGNDKILERPDLIDPSGNIHPLNTIV